MHHPPTATSTTQFTYAAAGNTRFESTTRSDGTLSAERASHFGSDDRLVATDARTPGKQLVEEYRYYALGRRAWLSTQWRCAPSTDAAYLAHAVTSTIWDGVQELAEIRARYDTRDATREDFDFGVLVVDKSIVRGPQDLACRHNRVRKPWRNAIVYQRVIAIRRDDSRIVSLRVMSRA